MAYDPNAKIDLSKIDLSKLDLSKLTEDIYATKGDEGSGVTDECINCYEPIVSTGVHTVYNTSYDEVGQTISIPYKRYIWVHEATRIPKCAIGDKYAAGNKRP
jgi:hypothetical protein